MLLALALAALAAAPLAAADVITFNPTKDAKGQEKPARPPLENGVVKSEDFMKIVYEYELKGAGAQRQTIVLGEFVSIKYGDAPEELNDLASETREGKTGGVHAEKLEAIMTAATAKPFVHQTAMVHLGMAQVQKGDPDAAIATLTAFIAKYPDSRWGFEACGALMDACAAKRDAAKVKECYEAGAEKAKKLALSDSPVAVEYAKGVQRESKMKLGNIYMALGMAAEAAELLKEVYSMAMAERNYAAAAAAVFQQAAVLENGKKYREARGVLQQLADVVDRPNESGFDPKRSLYMDERDADQVGAALIKIGDLFRQEAEETKDPNLLREAITPYCRAATMVKFSREPKRHAEALIKYARALVLVAEAEHAPTRGKPSEKGEPSPYDTLVKQAWYAAKEAVEGFPGEPVVNEWLAFAQEKKLAEIAEPPQNAGGGDKAAAGGGKAK